MMFEILDIAEPGAAKKYYPEYLFDCKEVGNQKHRGYKMLLETWVRIKRKDTWYEIRVFDSQMVDNNLPGTVSDFINKFIWHVVFTEKFFQVSQEMIERKYVYVCEDQKEEDDRISEFMI